jgi:hypothetical protein
MNWYLAGSAFAGCRRPLAGSNATNFFFILVQPISGWHWLLLRLRFLLLCLIFLKYLLLQGWLLLLYVV